MDEQTRKKRRRLLTILSVIVMGSLVAYMIYCGFVIKRITMTYRVLMAAGIILFWLLEHVIAPIATGDFAGKRESQMRAYRIQALLSLVGYLGLVYFALSINQNNGIYGAVVYVVTVMLKRRYYDEYANEPEEAAGAGGQDSLDAQAALPEDVMSLDASSREARLQALAEAQDDELEAKGEKAAAEDETAPAKEEAPKDMKSRVLRLNELADQIGDEDGSV